MQLIKCDICKKAIKNNKISAAVRIPNIIYKNFDFCEKCGEPIAEFLEKTKLFIKQAKKK